jgi:hypothetical protein
MNTFENLTTDIDPSTYCEQHSSLTSSGDVRSANLAFTLRIASRQPRPNQSNDESEWRVRSRTETTSGAAPDLLIPELVVEIVCRRE